MEEVEKYSYDVYVTDGLRALNDCLATAFGGSSLTRRWYDVVNNIGEDEKDADEIKDGLKAKINERI